MQSGAQISGHDCLLKSLETDRIRHWLWVVQNDNWRRVKESVVEYSVVVLSTVENAIDKIYSECKTAKSPKTKKEP